MTKRSFIIRAKKLKYFSRSEKTQSDRAMLALKTLSKLSPAERLKLQAALQSLNNNSYVKRGAPLDLPPVTPQLPQISPQMSQLNPLVNSLAFSQSPLLSQLTQPHQNFENATPTPEIDQSTLLQNIDLKTNFATYRSKSYYHRKKSKKIIWMRKKFKFF